MQPNDAIQINRGQFVVRELRKERTATFYLLALEVIQPGTETAHDIRVLLYNSQQYALWRSGSSAHSLLDCRGRQMSLPFPMLSDAPYYLVLDNSFSRFTDKTVWFNVREIPLKAGIEGELERALATRGWSELWESVERARDTLRDPASRSGACFALRTVLLTLWGRVCERLSSRRILDETGKTPNVGVLKEVLEGQGVPPSLAAHVYGVASELGHAETRDGKPPAHDDAIYLLHVTEASCLYLLRLLEAKDRR